MFGSIARRTGVYDLLEPLYSRLLERRWRRAGRPTPPPSAVKRKIIREFARAYNIDTLVETGTYKADTVRALRKEFRRIYSIELDETLHKAALARCSQQQNATLLHGDSASALPEVLSSIDRPAIFWLDAHYSGGRTATAALETPIGRELATILEDPSAGHVVLIDDHREFVNGGKDYPTVASIEDIAKNHGYTFAAESDVIRLTP